MRAQLLLVRVGGLGLEVGVALWNDRAYYSRLLVELTAYPPLVSTWPTLSSPRLLL